MAFIICVAALIIMMFVFTQMLLSFSNNSSAAVESVDATVVEKKQGIYTHMQSEAHVPWLRVVFEMTDGSLMELDRKSTRLNSSHASKSRMPSSA